MVPPLITTSQFTGYEEEVLDLWMKLDGDLSGAPRRYPIGTEVSVKWGEPPPQGGVMSFMPPQPPWVEGIVVGHDHEQDGETFA